MSATRLTHARRAAALAALFALTGCDLAARDVVAVASDAGLFDSGSGDAGRSDAGRGDAGPTARLFEDDFETCDFARWDAPPAASARIADGQGRDSRCASEHGFLPDTPPNLTASFAPQREVWARAFVRMSPAMVLPQPRGLQLLSLVGGAGDLAVTIFVPLGTDVLAVGTLMVPAGGEGFEIESAFRPAAPGVAGTWRCVELHVRLDASVPTSSRVELFVDGVLELSHVGDIGGPTAPAIGALRLAPELHGTGAWPTTNTFLVDDVAVDATRVGCAAVSP